MGTTIDDFLNPEFVLLGIDDIDAAKKLKAFYKTLHDKEVYECTIEAELIKVSYNHFYNNENLLSKHCHRNVP